MPKFVPQRRVRQGTTITRRSDVDDSSPVLVVVVGVPATRDATLEARTLEFLLGRQDDNRRTVEESRVGARKGCVADRATELGPRARAVVAAPLDLDAQHLVVEPRGPAREQRRNGAEDGGKAAQVSRRWRRRCSGS